MKLRILTICLLILAVKCHALPQHYPPCGECWADGNGPPSIDVLFLNIERTDEDPNKECKPVPTGFIRMEQIRPCSWRWPYEKNDNWNIFFEQSRDPDAPTYTFWCEDVEEMPYDSTIYFKGRTSFDCSSFCADNLTRLDRHPYFVGGTAQVVFWHYPDITIMEPDLNNDGIVDFLDFAILTNVSNVTFEHVAIFADEWLQAL